MNRFALLSLVGVMSALIACSPEPEAEAPAMEVPAEPQLSPEELATQTEAALREKFPILAEAYHYDDPQLYEQPNIRTKGALLPMPDYTQGGEVAVEYLILPDGNPVYLRTLESFMPEAEAFVRHYLDSSTFTPGKAGGLPVPVRRVFTMPFPDRD